jgi:hypothetical protein
MRQVYVPLTENAIAQLLELARRELREPKVQAAWLILDGLRRAGLPVDTKPRPTRPPRVL